MAKISPKSRRAIFKDFKGRCFYCNQETIKEPTKKQKCLRLTATIDHFWPWTRGGGNVRDNLVLCCSQCNTAKGHREPTDEEWRRLRVLRPHIQMKKLLVADYLIKRRESKRQEPAPWTPEKEIRFQGKCERKKLQDLVGRVLYFTHKMKIVSRPHKLSFLTN